MTQSNTENSVAAALTAQVRAAVSRVQDPEIRKPLLELGMLPEIRVTDSGHAHIALELTIAGCPAATQIENEISATVLSVPGVTGLNLDVSVMSPARRKEFIASVRGTKPAQFGPESLTRVLAVTSGKGGVGKSTVTANLAVELSAQGFNVGLIDADIFGFSIPALMGVTVAGKTVSPTRVDNMILPPVAHGVKTISIGMFLGDADSRTTAVSWRGPMLHRTLEQFLSDVFFGDLDFLLLDLPPGTGDIALSMGQLLPQAEVIVVTTPQPAAADVAVRSGLLAHQANQKVIGVIENLSFLELPTGDHMELFGRGGGAAVAERLSTATGYDVPLLTKLPQSAEFTAAADEGVPPVLSLPANITSKAIKELAAQLLQTGKKITGKKLPLSVV